MIIEKFDIIIIWKNILRAALMIMNISWALSMCRAPCQEGHIIVLKSFQEQNDEEVILIFVLQVRKLRVRDMKPSGSKGWVNQLALGSNSYSSTALSDDSFLVFFPHHTAVWTFKLAPTTDTGVLELLACMSWLPDGMGFGEKRLICFHLQGPALCLAHSRLLMNVCRIDWIAHLPQR